MREAAKILKDSPIYIEEMPDFSLQDVENTIKKNIRDHDVKYVFHDYIHTSLKILEEIQKKSGVNLREDNILFILSNKLKDICNTYGVFIESATQLNGDWKEAKVPDQNLLRGAKAIADKVDYGAILLPVSSEDIEALETILSSNIFDKPVIKLSVYKNRRGRYKDILIWCKSDRGTCRINPLFITDYQYDKKYAEEIQNLRIDIFLKFLSCSYMNPNNYSDLPEFNDYEVEPKIFFKNLLGKFFTDYNIFFEDCHRCVRFP